MFEVLSLSLLLARSHSTGNGTAGLMSRREGMGMGKAIYLSIRRQIPNPDSGGVGGEKKDTRQLAYEVSNSPSWSVEWLKSFKKECQSFFLMSS